MAKKNTPKLTLAGITLYTPQKTERKQNFTDHICPWCKTRAEAKFVIPKNSHLDPRIGKIGICTNEDCLNTESYSAAHHFPPLTKKELRSRKTVTVAGMKFTTMELDIKLEQKRHAYLAAIRLRMIGAEYNWLACPVCKEWKMEVLDDSAPGGFYAVCKKCDFKAHIDRT